MRDRAHRKTRNRGSSRRSVSPISPRKSKRPLLWGGGGLVLIVLVAAIVISANLPETKTPEPIEESAEVILNRLIVAHPNKTILQSIRSGELFVFISDSPTKDLSTRAGFILLDSEILRLPDERKIKHKGLVPVIAFNGKFLKGTYSNLFKQAAIAHEFAHFLTWKKGAYPEHLLLLETVIDTTEEVELFYEEEVNGYTKQCAFLLQAGAVDQEKICSGFKQNDLIAFRREIAKTIGASKGYEKFAPLLLRLAENQ